MPIDYAFATPVALPAQSGVRHAYRSVHLADAFAIRLPAGASLDPEVLARFMFAHQPAWIGMLMGVRDTIVTAFGLKTGKHLATLATQARTQRVGIFKIYSKSATEIVVGEDDKHLDFRVSILRTDGVAPGTGPVDGLDCRALPQPAGTRLLAGHRTVSSHGRESQFAARGTDRLAGSLTRASKSHFLLIKRN